MVLDSIGGGVTSHKAVDDGAIENLVRMHHSGQHAPHRITIEDTLIDAGGALVGVDLEHIGHARQVLQCDRDPRGSWEIEQLNGISFDIARGLIQVNGCFQSSQANGAEVFRTPYVRCRPGRDHQIVRVGKRRQGSGRS
jgi:hypothetical protein